MDHTEQEKTSEEVVLPCATANVVCIGRVNGMSERDEQGSYLLLSTQQQEGQPYRCRISLGGAEALVAEINGALRTPHPSGDTGEIVERLKVAFWASLTNANAGMKWLDYDSMEEMIEAAWVGFEDAARARTEQQAATIAEVVEMVRLFPEAFDTLTRQEMRDAKGNWRSLIDQQTKALSKLRATLERTKQP